MRWELKGPRLSGGEQLLFPRPRMFPPVLNGTDNPSRLNTVWDKFLCAAVDNAVFATFKCTSVVRCQCRQIRFHPSEIRRKVQTIGPGVQTGSQVQHSITAVSDRLGNGVVDDLGARDQPLPVASRPWNPGDDSAAVFTGQTLGERVAEQCVGTVARCNAVHRAVSETWVMKCPMSDIRCVIALPPPRASLRPDRAGHFRAHRRGRPRNRGRPGAGTR
jgi:hypothetical protein